MFLPCNFNTKDKESGWVNTDHIIDVVSYDTYILAYTMDEERCSYVIDMESWTDFLQTQ